MWFCCFLWIIFFFVASSLVGVIQAVLLCFFTHTVATRVRVLFLVCFVSFFFWCVCVWCDKCNDFVFHYLLDYSCRFFCFFSCFSRFCTIIRSFSKNRWFQSMCGCRKFVRTCSLFSRGDRNSSQSSGFVDFCSPSCSGRLFFLSVCAPFYRNFMFCFGFKTTAKCFSLSSRTVCFSLLLFVVTLVFFVSLFRL